MGLKELLLSKKIPWNQSKQERGRIVNGVKLVIARLALLLMLHDLCAVDEFFGGNTVPEKPRPRHQAKSITALPETTVPPMCCLEQNNVLKKCSSYTSFF
jgi:hypothetical protein